MVIYLFHGLVFVTCAVLCFLGVLPADTFVDAIKWVLVCCGGAAALAKLGEVVSMRPLAPSDFSAPPWDFPVPEVTQPPMYSGIFADKVGTDLGGEFGAMNITNYSRRPGTMPQTTEGTDGEVEIPIEDDHDLPPPHPITARSVRLDGTLNPPVITLGKAP